MNLVFKLALVGISVAVVSVASADERFLSAFELGGLGLRPVNRKAEDAKFIRVEKALPSRMDWPVAFEDEAHAIAQNFVQHQDYGTGQYYHGGCDLRARADSEVRAPIAGRLVGVYYGYRMLPNGDGEKWEKPWDGNPTPSLYFELAIVTDDGHRLEIHHVDPMSLPRSIVDKLNAPGSRVVAGELLAYVAKWPTDYDHVHYNIYDGNDTMLNPEKYSLPVRDTLAPMIRGVYGVGTGKRTIDLTTGEPARMNLRQIVVATTDTKDESVYVQMPVYFELAFASGEKVVHDFRDAIRKADGTFPDIREVFVERVTTPSGDTLENRGNYGKGLFLVQFPVPAEARGVATLRVIDQAGNVTTRRFEYLFERPTRDLSPVGLPASNFGAP